MNTIAFFNNKGGVGKTTLVYHLAWMYAELGASVVAVDLDPQSNLTTMFLGDERLVELWPEGEHTQSVLGAVAPILRGLGDITEPHVESIAANLGLVVGDLALSRFEAKLSLAWPACLDNDEAAFRAESAFHRLIAQAAKKREASVVLIDVGPNLGAISRAAIIAANSVVLPLAPDLFSLQGLRNIGPTLRDWRREWRDRLERATVDADLPLPSGDMHPVGYVVMQHAVRAGRPTLAYQKWTTRIPGVYAEEVAGIPGPYRESTDDDDHCLATLKHYRSLMAMAQEARKPVFHLRAADGAIGGHLHAAQDCQRDFEALAMVIAGKCGLSW